MNWGELYAHLVLTTGKDYDIAGKRDVVVNLNQVKLIIMSEIEEKKGWFSRWLG